MYNPYPKYSTYIPHPNYSMYTPHPNYSMYNLHLYKLENGRQNIAKWLIDSDFKSTPDMRVWLCGHILCTQILIWKKNLNSKCDISCWYKWAIPWCWMHILHWFSTFSKHLLEISYYVLFIFNMADLSFTHIFYQDTQVRCPKTL